MQSLCGKLRSGAKQTLNSLRTVDFKQIASVESYAVHQFSPFSSGLRSSSPLLLNRIFGTELASVTSSRSGGIASSLPSYRCLSSSGNESASDDSSAILNDAPRIKFKRPDKTARHIMQILDKEAVEEVKANREIPDIQAGYIVELKVEVPENKRRVSIVKGVVIARRNAGLNTTFRLRRVIGGVGIESLFLLYSPNIKEITVLQKKRVRRAKLYYLREKMNALKGK